MSAKEICTKWQIYDQKQTFETILTKFYPDSHFDLHFFSRHYPFI